MIAPVTAAIAEFERDLVRERVISGIAPAKSKQFGCRLGQRASDCKADEVIQLTQGGLGT
jgi:hypothetical protein